MIVHVITGLDQGGAEAVLYRFVRMACKNEDQVVISLGTEGYYGPMLRELGIEVHTIEMSGSAMSLKKAGTVIRIIKNAKPRAVITWMYHANLFGGRLARMAGVKKIIWGIHNTNLDRKSISLRTRIIAKLGAFASHWLPDVIVACSKVSSEAHIRFGYAEKKFIIIPNGCDIEEFSPDAGSRIRMREKLGFQNDEIVIGMIARWDPQKDHANLVEALKILKQKNVNYRTLLVGANIDRNNQELIGILQRTGTMDKVVLYGPVTNVNEIISSMDIHVLSSKGEAFPNVILESMSCGVPCVVTNVGDTSLIVGDTGITVPPSDSTALANGMLEMISQLNTNGRTWIAEKCRTRIRDNFSIEKMVSSYESLYK